MYDITNEDTFNHLSYWLQSIDKVSAHVVHFSLLVRGRGYGIGLVCPSVCPSVIQHSHG